MIFAKVYLYKTIFFTYFAKAYLYKNGKNPKVYLITF